MPSPVPFADLRAAQRELNGEIEAAVTRALSSGWYVLGPELEAFEREFAEHAPVVPDGTVPVWQLFTVDHDDRDECRRALSAEGIESLVHYPVLPHQSGVYRDRAPAGEVAERLAASTFSLPLYPQLDPAECVRAAGIVKSVTPAPAPA